MVEPGGTILIVEDPLIQRLIGGILVRAGYRVVESEIAAAAALLRTARSQYRLLITNKPAEFLEFASAVPLLYVAACPDRELARRFARWAVMRKPFHPEQLLALAMELTGPVVP